MRFSTALIEGQWFRVLPTGATVAILARFGLLFLISACSAAVKDQ